MITVKFTDGELIQGRGWLDLPNKDIQKVKLQVETKTVIMEGYESYNYLNIRSYITMGGQGLIQRQALLGRKGDEVRIICFNLNKKTYSNSITEFGKEFKGRPSTGWKTGIPHETPQYKIL